MGGSHSVEIPGGGTEGYHVLRVGALALILIMPDDTKYYLNV